MRPKEFDPDEALGRAMQVFWRKGYEATSMQELVDEMGINRQSLYDTYGGKHELFLASLDRYLNAVVSERFRILEQPGSALAAIRQFFKGLAEFAGSREACMGCLVANTASELAPHDKEVARRIALAMARVEEAFYRTLLHAKNAGELSERHNPRAIARFFACFMLGGSLMAKTSTNRKAAQDVIAVALSVLD